MWCTHPLFLEHNINIKYAMAFIQNVELMISKKDESKIGKLSFLTKLKDNFRIWLKIHTEFCVEMRVFLQRQANVRICLI